MNRGHVFVFSFFFQINNAQPHRKWLRIYSCPKAIEEKGTVLVKSRKKKVLPHHLREKPLLERLFASLQTFPGICDIL